jgi:phosphoribosylformimino-5-aminoimidazole carboxamide ribotide isomerase
MNAMDRSTFEILAAVDLRGGRVVRLRQGDFDRETAYDVDPVGAAIAFVEAGMRWLHVVDLDAARGSSGGVEQGIAAIVAAVRERASVEVAGGLRSSAAVDGLLAAGAARVVVGTAALDDPRFAARLVEDHGSNRIVAALDVREGTAVGHGWRPGAPGVDVDVALTRLADAGVELFEVTAIERDGLLQGPDLALLRRVVALRRGSIIAAGGIASVDDLRAVRDVGCSGAIVGRALYEGRLSIPEVLAVVS